MADTGSVGENVSPQKRKADDSTEKESSKTKSLKTDVGLKKGPISISLGKKPGLSNVKPAPGGLIKVAPIKMSLGSQAPKTKEAAPVKPKTGKVASVFNEDSESEEEEMPFEAKIRMRNVGRETPTAAGPNSFGKGNLGFCDRTKMIERELKKQMDEIGDKS